MEIAELYLVKLKMADQMASITTYYLTDVVTYANIDFQMS